MWEIALEVGYRASVLPWYAYRTWIQKKQIPGWHERWQGHIIRQRPEQPCVWFHGVSVGEVLQLQGLWERFRNCWPGYEGVITTSTLAGRDVILQKYPEATVGWWPWDFRRAVSHALDHVRPELVVLVELELWPNFLWTAHRRKIPVMLVNGRLSARSYHGYRWMTPMLRSIWPAFEMMLVQHEDYAERFLSLGCPPERLQVTGNIKYDGVVMDREHPYVVEMRHQWRLAPEEHVFIAGSTQDPEELYALQVWSALQARDPRWRLMIVPRHPERFASVAQSIAAHGWPVWCRTAARDGREPSGSDRPPVLLLDTLGELKYAWGLADIAFVGGSFTQRGGQNMLEPAGYGASILFGPHTWNFKDAVEQLLAAKAAVIVHNPAELRSQVLRLAQDSAERRRMGEAARSVVLTHRGATDRTWQIIQTVLERRARRRLRSEKSPDWTENPPHFGERSMLPRLPKAA
ncbi:MAG: 3-deoxy-D-manno-octulosonic acid transferase [Planctomycetaceae bacterium]|nr:MAG: 3-deoxy-D-manno-octulosonic acid transferase [Planctomycetaceae bacterium]